AILAARMTGRESPKPSAAARLTGNGCARRCCGSSTSRGYGSATRSMPRRTRVTASARCTAAMSECAGRPIHFRFPAKSGKTAEVTVTDAGVARVVARLAAQRARRLFTIAGAPIDSDDSNSRLPVLTYARVTAKDFRTWNGTRTALIHLRA